MDQTKEILNFLENTLAKLNNLTRDEMLGTTNTLDSILIRHYDERVSYKSELKDIRMELQLLISKKTDTPPLSWPLKDVKVWYKTLLESMISELKLLGLPSKEDIKIDKSITVSVNQNQSQMQTQTQKQIIDIFLESIKDEISGKQLKELHEIIDNEPDIYKAKSRILGKVKDFGIDVCSNIIANIITNPVIYSGLI
jgi:riboflavin synthase